MIKKEDPFQIDDTLIMLSGKASLLELKIKLLLSRDGYNIKGKSCNEAKKIMYTEYSKYFSDEDRKSIDKATWFRNKLVHFELKEVFKNQKNIPSITLEETIDIKKKNSTIQMIYNCIKRIVSKESQAVGKNSSLFGQYVELGTNYHRFKEIQNCLDKAIRIVTKITSNNEIAIEKYKNKVPNQWREK